MERSFGEGAFERGGRPSGGYAQGGYETHTGEARRSREAGGRGYGGHGRSGSEPRSWRGGDHSVREVMTPHAEVLNPNMTLREAARRMRSDDLGAYPVAERDRLIGMITDRDIVVRAVANDRPASATTVREVMSPSVIYCFEDEDVEEVAELMADHQVRRIPVLNRDKRLVGVVALADLGLEEERAARRALAGVSERTGAARR